jgi:hypothetical protein
MNWRLWTCQQSDEELLIQEQQSIHKLLLPHNVVAARQVCHWGVLTLVGIAAGLIIVVIVFYLIILPAMFARSDPS